MRRTSTIVARFVAGTARDTIRDFFNQHDIDGISVSDTLNRFAIEVPTGREKQFIELFRTCGMFSDVRDNFLGGERPSTPFKRDDRPTRKIFRDAKPRSEKPEVPYRDQKKPSSPRKDLRGGI